MLVLSRKVGERITIGDDVQIIITRFAGGRVSLGIDAPKHVAVRRHELESRPMDRQTERFAVGISGVGHQDSRLPA
ncbi:hypothetical protein Q31b_32820 [Novipirellula aureliae]|uniref:Translational regulator CsrA n=1 Tax=Novipirellula aureliae TaxID=2527966 RepID=A0A5C6DY22_9BACT|nr:carbon storage regulator [Novipirellula aureliae]TWU39966.1 hypothetical protein Q31b_32820 [Novipirellula aureliae]